MSIRRKRPDLALGPARALGVQGIRVIDAGIVTSGSATDPVVPYTGVAAGDLILGFAYSASATTTRALTSSGLTFTEVSSASFNSMLVYIAHAWSPDATNRSVTFASDSAGNTALAVLVLRGVDPLSPLDVSPVHTGHTAASPFTVPSADTITPRALAVIAAGSNDDNTLTAAAPWTARAVANIGTAKAFGAWTRPITAPGAIGTTEITETANGPDTAHSAILAVRALAG